MTAPRCPECGDLARQTRVLALVNYELKPDGSLGEAVATEVLSRACQEYVCGVGHEWSIEEESVPRAG